MKKNSFIIFLLLLFAAAPAWATVSISVSPPSPTTSDNVNITVSESGTFNTSCLPVQLDINNAASDFGVIGITPSFDPNQFCNNALTENQYTLSVNLGSLGAGDYTIRLSSVTEGPVEKRFSVAEFKEGITVSPSSPTTSDDVIITLSVGPTTFSSPCDIPDQLDYRIDSRIIELTQRIDPNKICNFVVVTRAYTLSVNVGKLPAGNYTIRSGPVEKSFSVKAFNTNLAGCATFDFFTGLLRIPDFEWSGTSYRLDFRLVGLNPVVYELVDIGFGEPSPQSAKFDFRGVFYVPCLNLAEGSYWTEWQLFNAGGATRMQLTDYGENL
jgi:hypothetical protein